MILFHLIILLYAFAGFLTALSLAPALRRSDFPLIWALCTFGLFYGGNVFLGWITGIMSLWLVVGIAAFAIASAFFFLRQQSATEAISLKPVVETLSSFTKGEWVLWSAVALTLACLYCIGLLLPYRVWDSPGYHVQNALSWAMQNRFVLDSFGDPALDDYHGAAQTFSNLKSVLPFVWLECRGSVAGMGITQFPFLLLLIAAIHCLFRRLQFARWMSPVAALFCLLTPEMLLQSTEVYTDIAFFASLISLITLLVILHQSASEKGFLIFFCVGFMLLTGTKPFGLMVTAPYGLVYLWLVFQNSTLPFKSRSLLVVRSMVTVGVFSLFTSGIWNLNALQKFDNPFYPTNVKLGEHVIFPGVFDMSVTEKWGVEALGGKTGLWAWWSVVRDYTPIVVLSSRQNGLGSAVYFLGLPALIVFAVGFWGERKRFGFVVFLFLIAWVFLPNTFLARMIFYQLVLYAVAVCWLLERMKKPERIVLLFLLAVGLGLNTARSIPALLYRTKTPETVVYALISGHTSWIQHQGFFNDYTPGDFWRDTALPGEKLAVYRGSPAFFVSRDLTAEARFGPRPKPQETEADWALRLKQISFTHLLIPAGTPEFDAVFAAPELFEIELRRRDSSAENPLGYLPPTESVLVRLKP